MEDVVVSGLFEVQRSSAGMALGLCAHRLHTVVLQ